MKSNNSFKQSLNTASIIFLMVFLTSCGGGGGNSTTPPATEAPITAAVAALGFDIKTFRFTWTDVSDATFYRLMENPDGVSGFTQVSGDIAQGAQTFDHTVALYKRTGASYFLQSCNSAGCTDGATISITGSLASAIGYFKSSNTATGDEFGIDVALSSDGNTLAVGAKNESGNTGAVYVFAKSSGSWVKQADITATTPTPGDDFGTAVSLSADGNILAVGAPFQNNKGAVFVYTRTGNVWTQPGSRLTAAIGGNDLFGGAVSLSDDGNTLAIGASFEASDGSSPIDDSKVGSGAVYVFISSGVTWSEQAYIKADNVDGNDFFGSSVSLSSDGNTLAVGSVGEDSSTTGVAVDTSTANNTGMSVGAVYILTRNVTDWTRQAYIKASDSDNFDNFGNSVSLSDDGDTLAVGSVFEDSIAIGVDGDDTDNSFDGAGAAYVFTRNVTAWQQQAYIKASNTDMSDNFGRSVSLSANGDTLAVGAEREQSSAIGVNGDEVTGALINAGASYLYTRNAGLWSQQAYLKASNTGSGDSFGTSIELSGDGATLAVGAKNEDGNATGIGGNDTNDDANGAGAVYLY